MSLELDDMEKDALIDNLRDSISRLLAAGTLWGIHLCFTAQAVMILLQEQGPHITTARKVQCVLVLVMLGLATVFTIHMWYYERYTMLDHTDFGATDLCITTAVYVISDLIVVWRAWVLWPRQRWVQASLAIASLVTVACAVGNIILVALAMNTTTVRDEMTLDGYAFSTYWEFLSVIPIMATNVLATGLVFWKAYIYRREVHALLNPSGGMGSGSRVGRVLILLIEGGLLYLLLWVVFVVTSDGPFSEFWNILSVMIVEISAMYPAIIVTLVSKFKTQQDVVNGTWGSRVEDHGAEPRRFAFGTGRRRAPEQMQGVVSHNIAFARRSSADIPVSPEEDVGDRRVVTFEDRDAASSDAVLENRIDGDKEKVALP